MTEKDTTQYIQESYEVGGYGIGKEPDLVDMVIRLTRKVTELEQQVGVNRKDLLTFASDITEADYKSGQALMNTEGLSKKRQEHEVRLNRLEKATEENKGNVEMAIDDIVMLDERTADHREKEL